MSDRDNTTQNPNTDPNAEIVLAMWRALAARDWDAVAAHIADDAIYLDVPYGAALAARGPADTVKRLKVGLEPLAQYTNHDGIIVSNGADVIYEHSETWHFATGEVVELPFVSVHRVVDGKVTVWKDYWDSASLLNGAPTDWMQQLAAADTSWLFDASGLV